MNFRNWVLGVGGWLLSLSAQAQQATVLPPQGENICELSSLELSKVTFLDVSGQTGVRRNKTTFNHDIILKDTLYTSGVGTHAPSMAYVQLNGATRFVTRLGVDDEASSAADHGIVDYVISGKKGKTVKTLKRGTIDRRDASTVHIALDVEEYDYLFLNLKNGKVNWADQVSWANAYFEYTGQAPAIVTKMEMEGGGKVVNLPVKGENGADIIPLSTLEIDKASCGFGQIQANRSIDRNPIRLRDTLYTSGVGTHATSKMIVKLNGAVTRFVTRVGIDDEVVPWCGEGTKNGVIDYRVSLKGEDDHVVVVSEGTVRATDPTTPLIDVDCNGWKYMVLEANSGEGGNSYDHVDWANAYFEYHEQNSTPPTIISEEEISSKLACATTVFSQPGVRFMHKLRAITSVAKLSVSELPDGLTWNAKRQLVEGIVKEEGNYTYNIHVELDGKTYVEPVQLTVSSHLQQPVPLMGWLSWNVVQDKISEEVVKTVADAFVSQGLLEAGYNYLCIDDLWHADLREPKTHKPLPDARKFPNGMKVVADYVHSKGLKFGIYSDAGDKTCAGRFGSYGFEKVDADQYAEWGVDLLKYDYCNAPGDTYNCQVRYKAMGDALKNSGRDILFYMCEWGVREPWIWGAETGATCWRCTYDTRDGWNGKDGGIGVLQSIRGMKNLWHYSGPNRFNDADMMCVGIHGTGESSSYLVERVGMTQTEYQSQFSLWSMWSSPLTLSFDLRKPITPEDLAIMTNSEIIALDQDRMGQQAELIYDGDDFIVFAKDLENGDVAVSVTNLTETTQKYQIKYSSIPALDADQSYYVRDLWEKKNLGIHKKGISTTVQSHETKVYRLSQTEISGIAAVEEMDMEVKVNDGQLLVKVENGSGQKKRVMLSDLAGRVVYAAQVSDDVFTVPVDRYCGGYVLNVVCNAMSKNQKITL